MLENYSGAGRRATDRFADRGFLIQQQETCEFPATAALSGPERKLLAHGGEPLGIGSSIGGLAVSIQAASPTYRSDQTTGQRRCP